MARTAPEAGRLRVVVLGGGVAGLEVVLALRALAEERVGLDVLAPEPHFWYRPLAVAEPFGAGHVRKVELAGVALACDAHLTLAAAHYVDTDLHVVGADVGPTAAADVEYDALVVATGARPVRAIEGALTFRGPADAEAVARELEAARQRVRRRILYVVPKGTSWPLPAYELALQTAHRFGVRADVAIVTPEATPLEVFGPAVASAVGALLDARGIGFFGGRSAAAFTDGVLGFDDGAGMGCEYVIALPTLHGDPPAGIPRDADGFVPVDGHGRVTGRADVFAAGDATAFSIKQGGIGAQQADAVAEAIAASAGASVEPRPFRPILRALLLTGATPLYLRHDPAAPESSVAAREALWWPADKIVGRYLAPFLAEHAQVTAAETPRPTRLSLLEIHADPGDATGSTSPAA